MRIGRVARERVVGSRLARGARSFPRRQAVANRRCTLDRYQCG